jgi:hypothetical protein
MKAKMKNIFLIWILILSFAISINNLTYAYGADIETADKAVSEAEVELRSSMRALWELRAILLRDYIVSMMNNAKDADDARGSILKNASALGASIRPYYGYWANVILAGMLKKDVLLTGKVIRAAKAGNKKDLDKAKREWYANAQRLADFFAIPRNQTIGDLTDILYKHLELVWGQIESMLRKDEARDLEYYERDRAHMLMFSDVLADGIIRQFPDRFDK